MAKDKINKSKMIRDTAKKNPAWDHNKVAEHLGGDKAGYSPNYVYQIMDKAKNPKGKKSGKVSLSDFAWNNNLTRKELKAEFEKLKKLPANKFLDFANANGGVDAVLKQLGE